MVCVYCGSKTRVINSRHQVSNNQVWRRRVCYKCKSVFTTEEVAQLGASWAVKTKKGSVIPFSRDKLLISLYSALGHRKTALNDASGLTDTIIKKLRTSVQTGILDSKTIARVAQVALNRFDKAASIHYQAYHRAN